MNKPFFKGIKELSIYSGFAESYLYKLTMDGKIPGASKPGGGIYFFDKQKIDEWLLGKPVVISPGMTDEEKEIEASTYISTH